MRAQTYDRAQDVPDGLWEAAAPPDFFFTKAFLEVMERSGVEDAAYRYVLLLDGDDAVGIAPLSRFVMKLDLMTDDVWVKRVHRVAPRLLEVAVVACGVPASLGQHHMHVVRPELSAEGVRLVHECMEAWAQQTRSSLLLWKEWSEDQGYRDLVRAQGYVALPSLHDHELPDLPASVGEYVGSMRSSYRRKYKQAVALIDGPGPVWTSGSFRLEEGPFTSEVADEFHRGYLALMERTKVRLETYTLAFFRGLATSALDTRYLKLVNTDNEETLTALLIAHGDVLAFALVAKDHEHYEDALYAILLRCIALYAVRKGFRQVRMGQTSSYSKCSVGARPRRLEAYIRVRGRLRHKALERWGATLFPEEELPNLSVFKDEAVPPSEAVPEKQTAG